jgi:hypothetical protein
MQEISEVAWLTGFVKRALFACSLLFQLAKSLFIPASSMKFKIRLAQFRLFHIPLPETVKMHCVSPVLSVAEAELIIFP